MADQLAREGAAIDTGEMLNLKWCQQRNMRNFAEIIGNEPDAPVRSHPFVAIETPEVNRPGIAAKSAFASKIEVGVEVTERQLPKIAMNGFAIPAAGEIRLRNSAPMAADFKDRDHVVGIVIGFEIEPNRISVSGVTGTKFSRSAMPYPAAHRS